MAYFNTTLGYTTQNGEWEILTDKELAKHDLLMLLHTRKGECDWDPISGTTILDKMFRPKTEALKQDIMDELRDVFDNDPRLTLNDIEAEDVEKGWIFYCEVSYLDGVPEQWDLEFSENGLKLLSTGTYPLGE